MDRGQRRSMIVSRIALLALTANLALGGCANKPVSKYEWGNYENLIYSSYAAPGSKSLEEQIGTLEKDMMLASSGSKPLPPGFHAHLGVLYFQKGDAEKAYEELIKEKAAYPESAVFIDRLLENLKKS
jgi:hypothetical protein